jgi:hypothetical protein
MKAIEVQRMLMDAGPLIGVIMQATGNYPLNKTQRNPDEEPQNA